MKTSRYSEVQVAYALRQAEAGTPVCDVCRGLGISEATFYNWKKKYGDLGASEVRRLRQLEGSGWYRKSTARDQSALRMRIREIAMSRPRFGYERIHVLLVREGWQVNLKRVHRLYCLEGLQVRMRVRRQKRLSLHRGPAPAATGPGQRWRLGSIKYNWTSRGPESQRTTGFASHSTAGCAMNV